MRGTLRRRGRDSWTARIELPPGPDGKRRQRRVTYIGTKREAEDAYERDLARFVQGEIASPGRMTVNELLDRWLESRRVRVRQSTMERYEGLVRDHLVPTLGVVRLQKLSPQHIEVALAAWRTAPRADRKGGSLSPTTVHHIFTTLRAALQYGVRQSLIPRNPCHFVEPVGRRERAVEGLDIGRAITFLHGLTNSKVYLESVVATFSGMRRGELLALPWSNVNLDTGELRIEFSLEEDRHGNITVGAPKTDRSRRIVVLPPFVVRLLREHRRELETIFGEGRVPTPVFVDLETGRYQSPDAFSSLFYYTVRSRGLERIPFHGLRHTYSNIVQRTGSALLVASRTLGHTTVALTADRYTDVSMEERVLSAQRLEDVFGPIFGGPESSADVRAKGGEERVSRIFRVDM